MDSPEAVHLRDGPMMHLVVPTIRRKGGVDCVYVVSRLNDQVRGEDVFRHFYLCFPRQNA